MSENNEQPIYGRRPYDNVNGNLGVSMAVLTTKLEQLITCQENMGKRFDRFQENVDKRLDKLNDSIVDIKLNSKDEIHSLKLNTTSTQWIQNPKVLIPVFLGFAVFVLALTGKINIVELVKLL